MQGSSKANAIQQVQTLCSEQWVWKQYCSFFAVAVVELQEKRHSADYDVMIRIYKSDAALAISTAQAALRRFNKASKARRLAYLSLLLFPPRG